MLIVMPYFNQKYIFEWNENIFLPTHATLPYVKYLYNDLKHYDVVNFKINVINLDQVNVVQEWIDLYYLQKD